MLPEKHAVGLRDSNTPALRRGRNALRLKPLRYWRALSSRRRLSRPTLPHQRFELRIFPVLPSFKSRPLKQSIRQARAKRFANVARRKAFAQVSFFKVETAMEVLQPLPCDRLAQRFNPAPRTVLLPGKQRHRQDAAQRKFGNFSNFRVSQGFFGSMRPANSTTRSVTAARKASSPASSKSWLRGNPVAGSRFDSCQRSMNCR